MAETHERRIPRGVIFIASLLIVVAFFSAGEGLLVRSEALAEVRLSRLLLFSFALVTTILAYGLLRMRRWAWAAMLSFVVVQAYFLVLTSWIEGGIQSIGLLLLAAIAGYMLLPRVRSVFLRPRGSD
jgi:hypothetical protein